MMVMVSVMEQAKTHCFKNIVRHAQCQCRPYLPSDSQMKPPAMECEFYLLVDAVCSTLRTLPIKEIFQPMMNLSRRLLTLALFAAVATSVVPAQTGGAMKAAPAQAAAAADANKVDINTATPDQLKALKGIGDAYAQRIVAGRPYTAKNQLSTRGILPAATYNGIKDQIVARAAKK
jgi:competence protein ComEA